jgi:hypothetical protein
VKFKINLLITYNLWLILQYFKCLKIKWKSTSTYLLIFPLVYSSTLKNVYLMPIFKSNYLNIIWIHYNISILKNGSWIFFISINYPLKISKWQKKLLSLNSSKWFESSADLRSNSRKKRMFNISWCWQLLRSFAIFGISSLFITHAFYGFKEISFPQLVFLIYQS